MMLEIIATACAGLFSGAAVYISVVQHPAVCGIGGDVPARFFPAMYQRAAPLQAGLASAGTLAGVVAWAFGSGMVWLVGALLLGAVVPFTLIVIKPVNDHLLAPGLDPLAPEIPGLMARWGRMHRVRSAAGLLAFVCDLVAGTTC